MTANPYANVNHTVHISTIIGESCKHCSHHIGADAHGHKLADSINRYIEQHCYRLLHVGTETSEDNDGRLWHASVAVLGK